MQIIKKIKLILIILSVIEMSCIYPFLMIRQPISCCSGGVLAYDTSEELDGYNETTQFFVAQYPYIDQIQMAFSIQETDTAVENLNAADKEQGPYIKWWLTDKNNHIISEMRIHVFDLEDFCYFPIIVKSRVKPQETYAIHMQYFGDLVYSPKVCMTYDITQHAQGSEELYINSKLKENMQIVASYDYETRLNNLNIIYMITTIIVMNLLIYEIIKHYVSNKLS